VLLIVFHQHCFAIECHYSHGALENDSARRYQTFCLMRSGLTIVLLFEFYLKSKQKTAAYLNFSLKLKVVTCNYFGALMVLEPTDVIIICLFTKKLNVCEII
jgi:hypothetical protein